MARNNAVRHPWHLIFKPDVDVHWFIQFGHWEPATTLDSEGLTEPRVVSLAELTIAREVDGRCGDRHGKSPKP